MLKRLLALAPAVLVLLYGVWIGPKYDRFVLPAFDGHVYAAMAENPRVFTLAPWGYRLLEPWMVHLLPVSSSAQGFYCLNLVLLSSAVFVVGCWLRRLGFNGPAAAIAASAFAMSPPARVLLGYQVLVDPLALLLLIVILYELVDPDVLVLMALFAATALTKETGLLALCLVPVTLTRRSGRRWGILDSCVVAAPALMLTVLLRMIWGNPAPPTLFSVLDLTLGRLIHSGWALAGAAALSGLLLPAFVGLFREESVELRVQGMLLWFLAFSLILLNPYHYSVFDLPRLSVFAWPALLPLALSGLGFRRVRTVPTTTPSERVRTTVSVLTLLTALLLVAATDSYRRAPFSHSPDPVAMVSRIRESLKTARALDAGETFMFDARSGRFASPIAERFNLTEGRRQRWFLYRGFGRDAPFESGAPVFEGNAEWLLPVLIPREVTISIVLEGPPGVRVKLSLSSHGLGSAPADGSLTTLKAPGKALFRGDNIVRLRGPQGVALRLRRFEVRLAPIGEP